MILNYYITFLSMQDSDNINLYILFNKIAYTITFYKSQCSKGQANVNLQFLTALH